MKKYVNLGHTGWKHPDADGIRFGCEASAKAWCDRYQADHSKIFHEDTRPTLEKVLDDLSVLENEAHGTPDAKWSTGPWDEYLDISDRTASGAKNLHGKWPDRYRWLSVYAVTGGSEGIYLHVDVIDNEDKRRLLFLGKSLGSSWEDCYASAGRIAQFLGA